MPESLTLSRVIHAPAARIFTAWLSEAEHGAMTKAGATVQADGSFTAWDGYISGKTLETQPNKRIVQRWRTTDFAPGSPDSHLVIDLKPKGDATEVTLTHTQLPDGQADGYEKGWLEYYFEPMELYFHPHNTLEDVGARVEKALEDAGHAVEKAIADAEKKAVELAHQVQHSVDDARKSAQKSVKAAVKRVDTARKQAVKNVSKLRKKVQALAKKAKPKPAATKKPAPKKAAAKKAPAKKAAPKKAAPRATRRR